jgi:hypothetical protein
MRVVEGFKPMYYIKAVAPRAKSSSTEEQMILVTKTTINEQTSKTPQSRLGFGMLYTLQRIKAKPSVPSFCI